MDSYIIYETLQNHIMQRVRLRESALTFYLGAAGAIFGFAFGQNTGMEILLIIPFLSLGVAAMISQHHKIIGAQMKFANEELIPYYKKQKNSPPFWETSNARCEFSERDIFLRLVANFLLICMPSIASLIFTYDLTTALPFPIEHIWWSEVFITLVTIIMFFDSHYYRKELIKDKTDWNNN